MSLFKLRHPCCHRFHSSYFLFPSQLMPGCSSVSFQSCSDELKTTHAGASQHGWTSPRFLSLYTTWLLCENVQSDLIVHISDPMGARAELPCINIHNKNNTRVHMCVHVQEACDNLRLDWFPLRESDQTGKQIYSLISIWLACRCSLIGLHLSVPADIRRGQQMCVLLNWLHDLNKQAVEMLCGLHTRTYTRAGSNIKHNLYVNMRLCQRTKWF